MSMTENEIKTEDVREQPLQIELAKLVRNRCPFFHSINDSCFEFDKHCKSCEYLIIKGIDNTSQSFSCGWIRYHTEIVKKTSYEDDIIDDDSRAIPSTEYVKTINCYSCGDGMKHSSGFSLFSYGDRLICKKCKTSHRYIGTSAGKVIFAVPLKLKSKKEGI